MKIKIHFIWLIALLLFSCKQNETNQVKELLDYFKVEAPDKFNEKDIEKIKTEPLNQNIKESWLKKYQIAADFNDGEYELYPLYRKDQGNYYLFIYNIKNELKNINYYEYITISKKDGKPLSKAVFADVSLFMTFNYAKFRYENKKFYVNQTHVVQAGGDYDTYVYEISFNEEGYDNREEISKESGKNYFGITDEQEDNAELLPENHAMQYIGSFFANVPDNNIIEDKDLNISVENKITQGLEIFGDILKKVKKDTKEEKLEVYGMFFYEKNNATINIVFFEAPALTYQIYAVFHKKRDNDYKYQITDYLLIGGVNDTQYNSITGTKVDFNKNEITFNVNNNDPASDSEPVSQKYLIDFKKFKFVKSK